MVKAYSPSLPSLKIIMECLRWDYANECTSWYARVPTASNIGDGPSRMCADEVRELLDGVVVPPVFPVGHVPVSILR